MDSGDNFDATKSFRGTVALTELVRYIERTDPNNETDWLEWKVGLDLTTPEGRFQVAKQILGFANRSPERAAVHAAGCGYVVLGVEPGNLAGQEPIDPAALADGLVAYVGADGPRWTPIWLSIDTKRVLVIEVGPPAAAIRSTRSESSGATLGRRVTSTREWSGTCPPGVGASQFRGRF
jgi:hypothetical protein